MQHKSIHFTKMQGIGNDYIYINGFVEHIEQPKELAKRMSDRHFGVGSDGLVLILPSNTADIRMRMFNADGTEAEMCGNASRCVGKLAYDLGLVTKDVVRLETGAGIKIIHLRKEAGHVFGATVDMGEPILECAKIPVDTTWAQETPCLLKPLSIDGTTYAVTCVSMGNPHAVVFMDAPLDTLNLPELGPQFEHHPFFPNRINTEFVQVLSEDRVAMRVWERGAGETLACGTGACAVGVACVLAKRTQRQITVSLLGGELGIDWNAGDGHVYMTGNAVTVFEGDYIL
ncbi:MAG: diaminopimelate epimerase [Desulfovibrio sp.]|nr:diaminopimelate epimerase [Desulfovibrio sp.]